MPYLNLQLPEGIETLSAAYIQGMQNAILASVAAGIFGAMALRGIATSFVKWKALSPSSYNRIIRARNYSIFLGVIGFIVYNVFLSMFAMDPSLAATFTAVTVAIIGVAYAISEKKE